MSDSASVAPLMQFQLESRTPIANKTDDLEAPFIAWNVNGKGYQRTLKLTTLLEKHYFVLIGMGAALFAIIIFGLTLEIYLFCKLYANERSLKNATFQTQNLAQEVQQQFFSLNISNKKICKISDCATAH